jgi:2-amino-4-hydroxy-6-hydroxymethyldihydropteridine diphosphokinase
VPHQAYLCLGTNLGDRPANLAAARSALSEFSHLEASSSIYETEPWGYADQPRFLNQVIRISTALEPEDLLAALKNIETRLGRQPTFRYGPRPIDIDILFYDDLLYNSGSLIIPHPRLASRAFVLVPLMELAPDFIHPGLRQPISQLSSQVDAGTVHLYKPPAQEGMP